MIPGEDPSARASPGLPALRADGAGVLLKVRAAPGASRDRVLGVLGDALKVAVAARPEKGKANTALARVLASGLGVAAGRVRLQSGAASRDKWFRIDGATVPAVEAMVRGALESSRKRPAAGGARRNRESVP